MPFSTPGSRRAQRRRGAQLTGAITAVVLGAGLTGCGPGAAVVESAPDAANPDCAPAMLAMPGEISGQQQRETTSQGTTAYGDPASMIVRCGVAPPPPTTDMCSRVNGVDWIIRETGAENEWYVITYGRDPALEVTFDTTQVPSSTALIDLSSAVSTIGQDRQCLSVEETLDATG